MTDTIVVAAPAKVNLYLAVGAAGADGYHDVTTVLAALEFGDEVTIAQADALSLVCTPDVGVAAEDNLAYRAAVAFAATCGREPSVALRVTKRVPAGAGLGGGSSDAAAVLRGLASLWGVDGDDTRLRETAVTLGADVPFFLDAPCALMGGRGDVLLRGIDAPQLDLVVVWPRQPVPTAAAYRAFDAAPSPVQPSPDALLAALESADRTGVAAHLFNAMTPASAGLVPAIADALALVGAADGVEGAAMCGSGSAVFGITAGQQAAERCAAAARARGWWAVATRTAVGRGTVLALSAGDGGAA